LEEKTTEAQKHARKLLRVLNHAAIEISKLNRHAKHKDLWPKTTEKASAYRGPKCGGGVTVDDDYYDDALDALGYPIA